jgi:glucokinase
VAGPVLDNRCATTNLPWIVDGAALAERLGLCGVELLNDLEAVGHGLDLLRPGEILELQAGEPGAGGHRAVIAAGTGLGEAGLFWDGERHRPFATEGGHADFAPGDDLEVALLQFLRRDHAHVSWERVVSGLGLVNLYRFLRQSGEIDLGSEPPGLAEEIEAGDPGAVISRYAAGGKSPLCGRALELFVKLYGAEAGNLALKTMAVGGLYIGGGIAPRNLDWMRNGIFLESFRSKGRMRPLLESMPVRVILNPRVALLGAARRAADSLD